MYIYVFLILIQSFKNTVAAMHLEASSGTLNVFILFKICLCQVDVYVALESLCKIENHKNNFDFFYFSWEDGGTLSQNSYTPSRNL